MHGPCKIWQWSDKNTCIIAVHEGVPSFGHISDFLNFFIFIYFFYLALFCGNCVVNVFYYTCLHAHHLLSETAEGCDHIRENIIL